MCSLSGLVRPGSPTDLRPALEKMNRIQEHRGPDGSGYYVARAGKQSIGLAHNRLAIIDLSAASAQPFQYRNRFVLVYNGELYNYRELRHTLIQKGYAFDTSGDTEVVAAAFDAYGPDCVEHFDGMFAFAIWDQDDTIFLARDRFGEKPLYFQSGEKGFCFASEINAILSVNDSTQIDETFLYNFLTLGFTRRPDKPWQTFYQNILQLPPAHRMQYQVRSGRWEIERYWDLDKESVSDHPEAVNTFCEKLLQSVSLRLHADVPCGTSLSGGIDSSTLVALISHLQPPVYSHKAFSAVFPGFEKDESARIHQMADQFKIRLHSVSPGAETFADRLESVILHHGDPIASASVFAQYLVYEEAGKQGIRVLLDGQGADEALAGYTKYTHWYLQEHIRTAGWHTVNREASAFRENGFLPEWGWKNRIAASFPALTAWQLEKRARTQQRACNWIDPSFRKKVADPTSITKPVIEKLNDIQYQDLMVMGLEELLRYADRNSMAHGVEVRLPFLAHHLVQFILSLPSHYRMREGYTKWILRKAMTDRLPENIIWQKGKIGFEPPQRSWMNSPAMQDKLQKATGRLKQMGILRGDILPTADPASFRILVADTLLNR